MDKYEFNLKVEQMKKMVKKGDYSTAMKIADGIDWRRVRNAGLLSTVAQIYENNNQYQEAKEILLLALERAPIGKRLLFKLTELELKENNISEAESYYQEYCELAQDDSGQYLLRYEILKEKGASLEQLISALESYTREELDEKWMYELAELYSEAGMVDDCIAVCDRIMLMFGLGKYVDKAMDLKMRYAPLTKYQMDLMENRDKYEEQLRAVEQEYSMPGNRRRRMYEEQRAGGNGEGEEETEEFASYRTRLRERQEKVSMKEYAVSNGDLDDDEGNNNRGERPVVRVMERPQEPQPPYEQEAGIPYREEIQEPVQPYYEKEPRSWEKSESEVENIRYKENGYEESAYPKNQYEQKQYEENRYREPEYEDEQIEGQAVRSGRAPVIRRVQRTEEQEQELRIHMHEEEVEKHLAEEMSKMSVDDQREDLGATRIMPVIRRSSDYVREESYVPARPAAPAPKKTEVAMNDDDMDDIEEIEMEEKQDPIYNHLMIEAENVEEGVHLAVKALKKLQEETGEKRSAAKLSSEKLNQKGLKTYLPKLTGKNLIINDAARMNLDAQTELLEFLQNDKSGMVVVLMDTPLHLEILHSHNPQLAKYFSYIGVETNQKEGYEPYQEEVSASEKREPARKKIIENVPEREAERKSAAAPVSDEKKTVKNAVREEAEYEEKPSRRTVRDDTEYEEKPSRRTVRDDAEYEEKPSRRAVRDDAEYEEKPSRKGLRDDAFYDKKTAGKAGKKEKTVQSMVQEPMNETREKRPEQVRVKTQEDNISENGVMSINDFAKYACEYAKSIDCSIVGKSLLALYERAELMDADGIPLIRENAEDLIEEAADKAEKKSLGRLITGIFSPRYDKEGKLILKESHFLN